MPETPTTWILTGSVDNFAVTSELGFKLIGFKERRRKQALAMEIGDRVIFYLTKVMAFGGSVIISSDLFEDQDPIWPGKPGNPDPYPWRRETKAELIVPEPDWLPAESVKDELEHIAKWPAEHWKLAFQGQLRTVSDADSELLMERMRVAAGATA